MMPFPPVLSGPSLPLAPEQRAVLSRGLPEPWRVRIDFDAALDEPVVAAALSQLMLRHPVLGHVFGQAEGYRGWRQQSRGTDGTPSVARLDQSAGLAPRLDLDPGQGLRLFMAGLPPAGTSLWLVAHPLLVDAASLSALARELADACLAPGAVGSGDVFQYAQFIEWRQELTDGDEASEGLAYWNAWLQDHGSHDVPRLAWRHVATGSRDAVLLHQTQSLDGALWEKLLALSASCGASPRTLLQAGWWSLLERLSGSTHKIAGGWRHDCRQDYEVMAGALGVFDKVLPVFSAWPPKASFFEGVSALERQLEAHTQAQEYWPVDDTPTQAHLAVGFSFDARPACGQGWRLVDETNVAAHANAAFELALHVVIDTDQALLTVSADARHHTAQAVAVLLDHYKDWVSQCVVRPEAPMEDFHLAGTVEEQSVLLPAAPELDTGMGSMLERVAHWARATPHAPALSWHGEVISYADLVDRMQRLAHWMTAQGAGPGTLVAVCLPRSADAVLALLAAWQVGAGWLPLEPDWPPARRKVVLDQARPVLLVDTPLASLPLGNSPCVAFGAEGPAPADIAYVLYTSGSTGTPKGVVIEHGQLLNYVAAASQAMGLERARRWGLTGTVAADLGHTALFGALYNGACLVVADAADMADGAAFARFLQREAIDGLKMVPSHLEALLDGEAQQVPGLVVLGGESASRSLVERLATRHPGMALYNHYGPTETTVGVLVHPVDTSLPLWSGDVLPLSRTLANCRVRVLEPKTLAPVPVGTLGELCVGGVQLCQGYLHGDGGERFIPDPWCPGERLYRTGDLACLLPEGGLRLAGRLDHQLKIRGFRVEPAEIEATLLSLDGVRQAIVMMQPRKGSSDQEAELVAFLVRSDGAALDEAQVRDQLTGLLPSHMWPARCLFLAELPRLANGKVDRRALEALPQAAPAAARPTGRAPSDDLEFLLVKGMALLLGREALGVDDDFFEMGGHSLQVIKLVARVRKQLKQEVAPGLVFDHPTAAALALALRAQAADPTQLERLAAVQRQLADLSPEQRAALEQRARQARQPDGAMLTGG
ncbi:non-ribosomal peptide synthetase [Paucibacter sp. XJ19-41]|uniref:non-ribosomal peptide synthetase n=1 Tax=Paucibacter sp. XJ19-41 TaxID=2927824 RepID=UPI00234BF866|nr:non-ribosomal peptide synthetase [Paucibacter sp. XJ19-41]MDC6169392.1 amino acid adenylation domain-containing protein [Paucibacter sp. XJ19-41]